MTTTTTAVTTTTFHYPLLEYNTTLPNTTLILSSFYPRLFYKTGMTTKTQGRLVHQSLHSFNWYIRIVILLTKEWRIWFIFVWHIRNTKTIFFVYIDLHASFIFNSYLNLRKCLYLESTGTKINTLWKSKWMLCYWIGHLNTSSIDWLISSDVHFHRLLWWRL